VDITVVEVVRDTGAVKLLRIVVVNDVGTVINPFLREGQLHGTIAQGVAQARWEDIAYGECIRGVPRASAHLFESVVGPFPMPKSATASASKDQEPVASDSASSALACTHFLHPSPYKTTKDRAWTSRFW
jgi:carbon-monoxide dehydrogenase large subunit